MIRLENSRTAEAFLEVMKRLLEWLNTPEQEDLRRAFVTWVGRVLLPGRTGWSETLAGQNLRETETMLEERVKEWQRHEQQQGWHKGLEEGRAKGLEEGRQEGWRQGEATLLLQLMQEKFGADAAAHYRARIEAADAATLLAWSRRILTAETPAAVFDEDAGL